MEHITKKHVTTKSGYLLHIYKDNKTVIVINSQALNTRKSINRHMHQCGLNESS